MIRINRFFWILLSYSLTLFAFAVYTYSQVDLNLTLSSNALYQSLQLQLTVLGYFNRPLSTLIYFFFITLLGVFYCYFLRMFRREQSIKKLAVVVGVTGAILLFSYPAFSYDIFNYLFDARVRVLYGQDPTTVRPLDFPNDTWTRFMRWTHRPSVYPFGWNLLITVPYFLGMGKFVLTLLFFKSMMVGAYFMSVLLVYKLAFLLRPDRAVFVSSLFALHPLVLVETLVSGHNDIVMMALFLLGIYLFTSGRAFLGFFTGLVSAALKYITLPASFVLLLRPVFTRMGIRVGSTQYLFVITTIQMFLVIYWTFTYEFQPWYLLWFLPLVAVLPFRRFVVAVYSGSYFILFLYAYYLYFGEWSTDVYSYKLVVLFLAFLLGALISIVRPRGTLW